MDRTDAINLIHGLVAIPSLSKNEAAASQWLVDQMQAWGYSHAFVDDAGNAVGELGAATANRTVLLLGHIDTVPGDIPVRVEERDEGPLLYGRGSVDAKGPLATFTAAVARLGAEWAAENNIRLVVVGAVEEEAATSKGARFIRDRFNGAHEPLPSACIIGEPSSWGRVTLGYKGRLLVEVEASQPMAHTAGPDAGVATVAVALWNWIDAFATDYNQGHTKIFDQLLPSLRRLNTSTDAQMQDQVAAQFGIRLPLNFDESAFITQLTQQAAATIDASSPVTPLPNTGRAQPLATSNQQQLIVTQLSGRHTTVTLKFYAHEPAWRGERNTALVRSFSGAIRQVVPGTRPVLLDKSGTSDMNVVGPAWGCPIVAYGPGDSKLDHTPHEHLVLDEYWLAVQVLEEALRRLAPQLK